MHFQGYSQPKVYNEVNDTYIAEFKLAKSTNVFSGNYTCEATNSEGKDIADFFMCSEPCESNYEATLLHLKINPPPIKVSNLEEETHLVHKEKSNDTGLILGLIFGIVLFLFLTSIVAYKFRKNNASVLTKEDVYEFINGVDSLFEKDQANQFSLNYDCKPYNKDKEVDLNDYAIGYKR